MQRLYVLPGGWLQMPKSYMVQGGGSEEVTVPMPSFLALTDKQRILIDTGCAPEAAVDAEGAWGRAARHFRPMIGEVDLLEQRLGELGLSSTSITDVVMTHLHMDHAGGLKLLSKACVWVQASEYRWALQPDDFARGGYFLSDFDHDFLDYHLLQGDSMVAPGVYVVATPGHTPGHQSVLISLRRTGWVCIVGDAADNREIYERRRMPGVVWSPEQAMASLARLKFLEQALGAKLLFNHDPTIYERMAPAPAYLD